MECDPAAWVMAQRFPAGHAEKRQALLAAVERIRETILAGAALAEENATLPPATVAALYESGLFSIKLPAVLGGAEADPVTQIEVFEAIARLDPAAGWCTMIGATSIGEPGAFLPDEAVAQIFAAGRVPTAACGLVPTGRAALVDGGYRLTGRWPFASGIRHAEWIATTAFVDRESGASEERRVFVVPAASIQIHDNWQVAGLEGTGSCDFSAADLFVPAAFSWNRLDTRPRRGGPIYLLGRPDSWRTNAWDSRLASRAARSMRSLRSRSRSAAA